MAGGVRLRDGEVPLARRLLLADWRRLLASLAGVGLALMLILLLDGLSAGIDARVTVYEQQSGADLYVAQPGTNSFLGSLSNIPAGTEAKVREQPAVNWTAPVRGFFTVPVLRGNRVPAYVVGWEPGKPGGPWKILDGRAPAGDGEIAVGGEVARKGSLALGSPFELLGTRFVVVGIAGDADMFMASFVFMTRQASEVMLKAPGFTSFILVGTDRPDALKQTLASAGIHSLTRAEIERNDLALKGQAYSAGLGLVVSVAFAVGTLVIALTIYTAIMERRREYGIVKAIGANARRLYRIVLAQSLVLAFGGLAVGAVFFLAGVQVLGWLRPQFEISTSGSAVVRVVVAAVVMGGVATVVPARRLNAMEPAMVFRGA
ncbi:MAG: FtsX-like permease family protein [Actinobacteria bacterium]|nr:FtsX-like permease family protein [Actinomycetota bacterium]